MTIAATRRRVVQVKPYGPLNAGNNTFINFTLGTPAGGRAWLIEQLAIYNNALQVGWSSSLAGSNILAYTTDQDNGLLVPLLTADFQYGATIQATRPPVIVAPEVLKVQVQLFNSGNAIIGAGTTVQIAASVGEFDVPFTGVTAETGMAVPY